MKIGAGAEALRGHPSAPAALRPPGSLAPRRRAKALAWALVVYDERAMDGIPERARPVQSREEVMALVEGGVLITLGTRDAALRPTSARAYGARVQPDRASVTVFVPEAVAGRCLANLRDNGRVAISFSNPLDARSVQVKGRLLGARPMRPEDEAAQGRYHAALSQALTWVGVPGATLRRIAYAPSVAIDVAIEEIFDQTPGPGAGQLIRA